MSSDYSLNDLLHWHGLWERLFQNKVSGLSQPLRAWGMEGVVGLAGLQGPGAVNKPLRTCGPAVLARQGCRVAPVIQAGLHPCLLLWEMQHSLGSSHSPWISCPQPLLPAIPQCDFVHTSLFPSSVGNWVSGTHQNPFPLPHWRREGIRGISCHSIPSLQ